MTQHLLTPANTSWAVLKNFEEQRNALTEKKEGTAPPVPKLMKGLHPPKWLKSFKIHCRNIIGACGVSIYYIMRPNVVVAMLVPPLAIDQSYSEKYGSLEDELIA